MWTKEFISTSEPGRRILIGVDLESEGVDLLVLGHVETLEPKERTFNFVHVWLIEQGILT